MANATKILPELPKPIDPDTSYTIEQLAQAAMVSERTIDRWVQAGLQADFVPGTGNTGARRRFLGKRVIAFMHGLGEPSTMNE